MTQERLNVSYEIHVLTDDPDGSQRQAQIDVIAWLIRRAAEAQKMQADEGGNAQRPGNRADT